MTTPAEGMGQAAANWRSDAAIAYAILRLTFAINIGLRGLTRIINGTDVFAADLLKQLQAAVIPIPGVELFGNVLPWIEAAIGLLLLAGFQTRAALIAGGLMMTALMTGVMSMQNFQTAWLQLTYALVFFILLAFRSWNLISVDAWMTRRSFREPPTPASRIRA